MHKVHLSLPFFFKGALISLALAATAPSPFLSVASPSTYSVPPFNTKLEVTLETLEIPTGGGYSAYLRDSSASLKEDAVSSSPKISSHDDHKIGAYLKPLTRKLRMSLWLLLFVGAGVVSLTLSRVSFPVLSKKEKEEKRREPIKPVPVAKPPVAVLSPFERLQKVRDLMPTAIRLATVVDTPEAASCISSFKECFEELDGVRDKDYAEILKTALAALQRLHRGAIEQAELLMLGDEASRFVPIVKRWGKELIKAQVTLKGPRVQQSVAPFVRTLDSLQGDIENLTKSIEETGERMRSQQMFENEKDEAALQSSAADLQQLRINIGARRNALRLAAHARSCAVETAKTLVVGQRELSIWDLDEQLAVLCFKTALAKARLKRKEELGTASNDQFAGADVESDLDKLQGELEALLGIASRLHLLAINIQTASSLEAAEFLDSDLRRQQEEAAKVLNRGAAIAARLPPLEELLDSTDIEVAANTAQWLENCFNSDSEGLLNALQQAQEWVKFLQTGVTLGNVWLGEALVTDQKSQVDSLITTASQREKFVAYCFSQLKESKRLSEVLSLMEKANEKFREQTQERVALQVLAQQAFFMQMLQDDLLYAVSEVRRTADYEGILEKSPEKKQYEKLQEHFYQAQQALKEAKTLEDAADAAVRVRAIVSRMQNLFLTSYHAKDH